MEFAVIVFGMFLSYVLIRVTFSVFRVGQTENLPPGPTPLPIIGHLHLLGDQPHQSLAKLAEVHGPIMLLKIGRINTLVISSAAAAKEVLQKQDLAFCTRHVPDALHAHDHFQHSVAFLPVSSTEWRTLRKIMNSNIFSSNALDASKHLRFQKVQELVAYCRKASQSNESVDIGRATFRTSLNVLSNLFFSKDLTDPYEDSGKEFKEVVGNIMIEAGKPNLADYFPVLKKIDPQGNRRRLTHHFGKVLGIFEELIKERLLVKKLKQDDILDVCLKISQEKPDEINRTQIKHLFMDSFVAGTDTTSSTVEWAMVELLRKPSIMEKAKDELKEVIGEGNILHEDDVLKVPYLQCIVKETLWIHPPLPLLIPRKLENQVKLNGYIIPKGTQVLVNAWAIGRDPTIWEDSLEFNLDRFVTSGIDIRGQDSELIPFGAGRRICPGLPLVVRMLPVMLGSLLNNFDWRLNDGVRANELDMKERFGITLQKDDPLCVVPMSLN